MCCPGFPDGMQTPVGFVSGSCAAVCLAAADCAVLPNFYPAVESGGQCSIRARHDRLYSALWLYGRGSTGRAGSGREAILGHLWPKGRPFRTWRPDGRAGSADKEGGGIQRRGRSYRYHVQKEGGGGRAPLKLRAFRMRPTRRSRQVLQYGARRDPPQAGTGNGRGRDSCWLDAGQRGQMCGIRRPAPKNSGRVQACGYVVGYRAHQREVRHRLAYSVRGLIRRPGFCYKRPRAQVRMRPTLSRIHAWQCCVVWGGGRVVCILCGQCQT